MHHVQHIGGAGYAEGHARHHHDAVAGLGDMVAQRHALGFRHHLLEAVNITRVHRMHPPGEAHPTRGGNLRRHQQDIGRNPLARHAAPGGAGGGEADDGLGAHRCLDAARRLAQSVCSCRLRQRFHEGDLVLVGGVALHFLCDGIHHGDRLHRPFAGRAFRRQHHRVHTIVNGVGHIRHFGAGGRRRGDHRFQHLRCNDHGLARPPGRCHQPLLRPRHLLRRQFHP